MFEVMRRRETLSWEFVLRGRPALRRLPGMKDPPINARTIER